MTTITKTFLRNLRPELELALEDLAARHNITFNVGNISFDPNSAQIKLGMTTNSSSGDIVPQYEIDFNKYCRRYGLEKSDLGRTFKSGSKTFTLVGCKPRATKYPLLGVDANGNTYKFPVSYVNLQAA